MELEVCIESKTLDFKTDWKPTAMSMHHGFRNAVEFILETNNVVTIEDDDFLISYRKGE